MNDAQWIQYGEMAAGHRPDERTGEPFTEFLHNMAALQAQELDVSLEEIEGIRML